MFKRIWLHIIFSFALLGSVSSVFADAFGYDRVVYRNKAGNSTSIAPKSDLKNSNNVKSYKKLTEKYLEEKGYNPHKFKDEIVGQKNRAKYNIHKDTETGELVLIRVKGNSVPIRTGEIIIS